MTVILNRSKRTTRNMKQTHSITDVEGLIFEKLKSLEQKGLSITERKKIRSEIIKLEKHLNDVNGKHINGKSYPVREKPPKISKEELLKLIDSVDVPFNKGFHKAVMDTEGTDLSGIFPPFKKE